MWWLYNITILVNNKLVTITNRISSLYSRYRVYKILFIFNSLLYTSCALANQGYSHWHSPSYIRHSFLDIALNNEYSPEISNVRKWKKTIHYSIVHRTADTGFHEQITKIHLNHLSDITGVKISPAQSKKQVNLTIIFSRERNITQELKNDFLLKDSEQITSLARNSVCIAHFHTNQDNSIKKAIVIIPVDRARAHAKLLSCVVEELTQIMGLPNDSDSVYPSIFNDKSSDDFLSGLDFILLKLLYHKDIKAGMNTELVNRKLIQILAQPSFQKLIEDSEYLVHQKGLFRYLN